MVFWADANCGICDFAVFHDHEQRNARHAEHGGEITLFVMQLLDDIAIAQDQLMENHSELHAALEKGLSAFAELREAHGLSDKDMDVFALVFRYGLFTRLEEAPLDEIVLQAGVSKQTVRARTRRLEEEGLLETTSLRPLRFRLTEAARAALA